MQSWSEAYGVDIQNTSDLFQVSFLAVYVMTNPYSDGDPYGNLARYPPTFPKKLLQETGNPDKNPYRNPQP